MCKKKINLSDAVIERIVDSITKAVPTERIYIFGSYARGEETPESDVDIYVVTNKDSFLRIDYEAMTDVDMSLSWFTKSVDIICLSKKEFDSRSKRAFSLEAKVLKEGVLIYEV